MDRKQEILAATLEALDATGETPIEEIRKRSGASIGSIYHHFGGKDGIAAALYLEILRDYREGVVRALGRPTTAEAGVKGLVRYHLRWVERNPQRALFLLRDRRARVEAREELREANRAMYAAIEDWVERQPAIRPLRREVFFAIVLGPAQEISRAWLSGRTGSPRRLEGELGEAAWRGIRSTG